MSFPARIPDPPLSEKLTQAIQTELRKEIRRIHEEEAKKTEEIYELREKIKEVTELNESLMRSLKLKKNTAQGVGNEVEEIVDSMKTHIKCVLESTPSKGWHVGKRWRRATDKIPEPYDIKKYVMVTNPRDVAGVIYQLLVHIDRYEREVEKYDENLNRWAKQLVVGRLPVSSIPGYCEVFKCPKGGNCTLPFVDKLLEESKFSMSGIATPQEAYPKVKV